MGSQRDSLAGVRIGMVVLPTDPWPETLATVQRLDRLGYDHVWLYDHLTWRQYRDRAWHATYPLLAGLAVGTRRIRLGTMVANLNVRHPVTLAKDAMTIDHLSGGRMVLGVGAAGLGFDATVLGQAPLTPRQRVDRLEEALELLDRLLLDDAPDRQPVDHGGDWYTVEGARNLPGCVQRPRIPLAVAAGGHRSIDVAARMGDAWITYGDAIGTDGHQDTMRVVADEIDRLDQCAAAAGRDPVTIDRILVRGLDGVRVTADLDAVRDAVGMAVELGVTDLVFHHPRSDDSAWNDPIEIVDEIAEAMLSV